MQSQSPPEEISALVSAYQAAIAQRDQAAADRQSAIMRQAAIELDEDIRSWLMPPADHDFALPNLVEIFAPGPAIIKSGQSPKMTFEAPISYRGYRGTILAREYTDGSGSVTLHFDFDSRLALPMSYEWDGARWLFDRGTGQRAVEPNLSIRRQIAPLRTGEVARFFSDLHSAIDKHVQDEFNRAIIDEFYDVQQATDLETLRARWNAFQEKFGDAESGVWRRERVQERAAEIQHAIDERAEQAAHQAEWDAGVQAAHELQARVWHPFTIYRLEYASGERDDDGEQVIGSAHVTRSAPDRQGWWHEIINGETRRIKPTHPVNVIELKYESTDQVPYGIMRSYMDHGIAIRIPPGDPLPANLTEASDD